MEKKTITNILISWVLIFSFTITISAQEQIYRGVVFCREEYVLCSCARGSIYPDPGYKWSWVSDDLCEYNGKHVEIIGTQIPCGDQKCESHLVLYGSQVTVLPPGSTDINVDVEAGWNMISVPLHVPNHYYLYLFPGAVSEPFDYRGYYIPNLELNVGMGYFLKFDSARTYTINGEPNFSDSISVSVGWNMIGSITTNVPVNTMRTVPEGIIVSAIYNYIVGDGYEETDTILTGKSYWVKVNQPGNLILSTMDIPCPGIPTVEYEGKSYNTVLIGSQCWLKENLDVGTMILGSDTAKDNGIIEKYCYSNDTSNCNTYGGLYQWNEAMQYTTTPGTKGICPLGWHIPASAEFQILSNIVGGDGNALKAIGQGTGTNTSGFSALLAGSRGYDGYFHYLSDYAIFWSSTEGDSTFAYYMYLYYSSSGIGLDGFYKTYGLSVRCLKD